MCLMGAGVYSQYGINYIKGGDDTKSRSWDISDDVVNTYDSISELWRSDRQENMIEWRSTHLKMGDLA